MPLASPPVACLQVRRLLPPRSPRKRLDAGLGRSGRPGRRWRPGPTTPSGLQHDLDAVVLLLLEDLVCRLLLEKKKQLHEDHSLVDLLLTAPLAPSTGGARPHAPRPSGPPQGGGPPGDPGRWHFPEQRPGQ